MRGLEERLRLALEGTETGFWEWHVDTDDDRVVGQHGPALRPAARDPARRRRRLPRAHRAPRGPRGAAPAASQAAVEHGTPYEFDLRVVPARPRRALAARPRPRGRGADGRTERITGLLSDVTERRHREEAHAFLDAASQVLAASMDPVRDARGGRAAGRPAARRLVRGPARADGGSSSSRGRPRRPGEGALGARAAGALPARPGRADRRARGDPHRPLRALPGDRPRAAGGRRARRGAGRSSCATCRCTR